MVPTYIHTFTCIHHGINRHGTWAIMWPHTGGPFSSLITKVPGKKLLFNLVAVHTDVACCLTQNNTIQPSKLRPFLVHPTGFGDDLGTNQPCAQHLQSQPWAGSSSGSSADIRASDNSTPLIGATLISPGKLWSQGLFPSFDGSKKTESRSWESSGAAL